MFVRLPQECKELAALCADKAIRTPLSVWKVQFVSSAESKRDGRGQVPLQAQGRGRVRELMLDLAPASCMSAKVPPDQLETPAGKTITGVSLFGCATSMVWEGMERNTLPSMRYQVSGTRQLCVAMIGDIIGYAADVGQVQKDGEAFLEFIRRVMVSLASPEDFAQFHSGGSRRIYRGLVKAGSFVYLPIGSFVAEKVVGTELVVGLRSSTLDANPKFLVQWLKMYDMMAAKEGSQDPSVKAFARFKELMPGGPDSAK